MKINLEIESSKIFNNTIVSQFFRANLSQDEKEKIVLTYVKENQEGSIAFRIHTASVLFKDTMTRKDFSESFRKGILKLINDIDKNHIKNEGDLGLLATLLDSLEVRRSEINSKEIFDAIFNIWASYRFNSILKDTPQKKYEEVLKKTLIEHIEDEKNNVYLEYNWFEKILSNFIKINNIESFSKDVSELIINYYKNDNCIEYIPAKIRNRLFITPDFFIENYEDIKDYYKYFKKVNPDLSDDSVKLVLAVNNDDHKPMPLYFTSYRGKSYEFYKDHKNMFVDADCFARIYRNPKTAKEIDKRIIMDVLAQWANYIPNAYVGNSYYSMPRVLGMFLTKEEFIEACKTRNDIYSIIVYYPYDIYGDLTEDDISWCESAKSKNTSYNELRILDILSTSNDPLTLFNKYLPICQKNNVTAPIDSLYACEKGYGDYNITKDYEKSFIKMLTERGIEINEKDFK